MCSDGEVEKVFGPSKTSNALLLLIEHDSSHSSWRLAGNRGERGVCDTNASVIAANIAMKASILDMAPGPLLEGGVWWNSQAKD